MPAQAPVPGCSEPSTGGRISSDLTPASRMDTRSPGGEASRRRRQSQRFVHVMGIVDLGERHRL